MIEIVNNHFKSLLNDLLIKAYYEKPISTYNNGFRWECVQIIKRMGKYDICIGEPIGNPVENEVYFGISYKQNITQEQEYLIEKLFEKWGI